MEKMTKFAAIMMALTLFFSAVGCAKSPETASSASEEAVSTAETNEEVTEKGTETETGSPEETDGAGDGTHLITDHAGNEVEVPNNAERIVICDIYPLPSIISVFFDSAEKIVGMAGPSMAAAKNSLLADLYPEILNAETGFIDGTDVNIEELMKLEPDVVFYNAGNKALGEQIRNAGLAGVAISAGKWQYDCLATLDGWIEMLDQIFPNNGKADVVAAYGKKVYDDVQSRVAKLSPEEREQVFFLFQYTDTNMLTCGNPSFGKWWCDAIGADCTVTEQTEQNSMPVGMEQVYTWDPSVIFVTNFTTATVNDIYRNSIGTYDWSPVSAVRKNRVYKLPLGMYRSYTAGVDAPIALYWMAKACYPDLFSDINITEETEQYYQEVFGITLTAEQANAIFNPDAAAGVMKK